MRLMGRLYLGEVTKLQCNVIDVLVSVRKVLSALPLWH